MATSSEDELIERLIEMVRARKYLYDPTDQGYKDAQLNRNAWKAIAKDIGVNTGEAAKKKWRNKRDHYIKIKGINKTKSGQAAERPIRYKWSKQLAFLNSYLEDAPTTSNVSDPEDEAEDNGSDAGSIGAELIVLDEDVQDAPVLRPTPTPPMSGANRQSTSVGNPQSPTGFPDDITIDTIPRVRSRTEKVPMKAAKKKQVQTETENLDLVVGHAIQDLVSQKKLKVEDPDELFLKSCLTQLKELPPRVKCEAKIEIMQLLYTKQFKSMHQPPQSNMFQDQPHTFASEQERLDKGPFMSMLSGEAGEEYFKY